MRREHSPRVVWVVIIALLAVACSATPDRAAPEAEGASGVPAPAPDDGGEHASEQQTGDEPDPQPRTTEETIAAMRAMDPARLAGGHGHAGHPGRADVGGGRGSVHPNGIDPERIVIPAIGVDADVIDLGLQAGGAMEVPTDFAQAGWFTPGPRPGRVGPAVIAGHVDSRSGPAVFFRLADLEAGDEIEVHDRHGEVVTFEVREAEQHPKDAFPTERVYAGTPGPELRLVTCGGVFDQGERSYRDNIIVYAERVDR